MIVSYVGTSREAVSQKTCDHLYNTRSMKRGVQLHDNVVKAKMTIKNIMLNILSTISERMMILLRRPKGVLIG